MFPNFQPLQPGTVYLIGAGPGDPDLITVKALKLLRRADTVLYDALLDPALLNEAPTHAERIYVGKRAGQHSLKQADINRLLHCKAYEYDIVVRLKGGDPFIFGRGGEEMVYLRERGVPVEIVPGVSSTVAAPAAVGVPVTHRGFARSVAFVTGHCATDGSSSPHASSDWRALARVDTLVVLMGLRNARQIAAALIEGGRAAETPALAIQSATLPAQQVVAATLATLADSIEAAQLSTPATLVIGDVVNLAALPVALPADFGLLAPAVAA